MNKRMPRRAAVPNLHANAQAKSNNNRINEQANAQAQALPVRRFVK